MCKTAQRVDRQRQDDLTAFGAFDCHDWTALRPAETLRSVRSRTAKGCERGEHRVRQALADGASCHTQQEVNRVESENDCTAGHASVSELPPTTDEDQTPAGCWQIRFKQFRLLADAMCAWH